MKINLVNRLYKNPFYFNPLKGFPLLFIVMLFMRFVLKCKEDEEALWKGIKAAINSKCRANKFYGKKLNLSNAMQQE